MKMQLLAANDEHWREVTFSFRGRGQSRDVYLADIPGLGDCVLKLQAENWEPEVLQAVRVASAQEFQGTLLRQYWHGKLEIDGKKCVGVLEEAAPLDCAEMLEAIDKSTMTLERKLQAVKVLWAGVLRLFLVLTQRDVKIDDVGPRNLACLASTPETLAAESSVEVRVLDWEGLAATGVVKKLFMKALGEMTAHAVLKLNAMKAR